MSQEKEAGFRSRFQKLHKTSKTKAPVRGFIKYYCLTAALRPTGHSFFHSTCRLRAFTDKFRACTCWFLGGRAWLFITFLTFWSEQSHIEFFSDYKYNLFAFPAKPVTCALGDSFSIAYVWELGLTGSTGSPSMAFFEKARLLIVYVHLHSFGKPPSINCVSPII